MDTIMHKLANAFSPVSTTLDDFPEGGPGDGRSVAIQAFARLFNLAGIQEANKFVLDILHKDGRLRISFKPGTVSCHRCGSRKLNRNGYNNYDRDGSLLNLIGIRAVLTKYKCSKCDATDISVTPDQILPVFTDLCNLIDKTILRNREDGMSYGRIAKEIESEFGIPISEVTVSRHFKLLQADALEHAEPPSAEPHSGHYCYDEQVLKKNGKKVFRLTLIDDVSGRLIAEERSDHVNKVVVREFLKKHVDRERIKSFVVDGRDFYTAVIRGLFGKKTGIQQCIVHVMDNTTKDYRSAFAGLLRHQKIPFRELYWKQLFFNVFYPRPKILKLVNEMRMKENHGELSEEEDREARKRLSELVKKHRRTASNYLKGYTEQKARKKFKVVLRMIERYPKRVQKRIRKIERNWDDYTLYLRNNKVSPTNNKCEQYYARTAQKTKKKRFRSDESLNAFVEKNNKLKERTLLEFTEPSIYAITFAAVLLRLATEFSF